MNPIRGEHGQRPEPGWLSLLFYLGLSLFACHELDAVLREEWRLLPVLSSLETAQGYFWFVLAHIPLFTLIFWLCGHDDPRIRRRARLVVDLFMIVHMGLHALLSGDPLYRFEGPLEAITVYGAAGVAALHRLLLLWAGRRRRRSE